MKEADEVLARRNAVEVELAAGVGSRAEDSRGPERINLGELDECVGERAATHTVVHAARNSHQGMLRGGVAERREQHGENAPPPQRGHETFTGLLGGGSTVSA